jgi:predicted DNA-binding transcriptional regulator AlpA
MSSKTTTTYSKFQKLKARGLFSSRHTLRKRQREEGFPLGKRFGPRDVRFADDEVEKWLASRPREDQSGEAA